MTEIRTVDTILGDLEQIVRDKQVMAPGWWVDAAQFLNLLIGDENDKLYEMEQVVAKKRVDLLDKHDKVNKVKTIVEATDEYKNARKQKAKIAQINEFIRIAKLQGRLASDEARGWNT